MKVKDYKILTHCGLWEGYGSMRYFGLDELWHNNHKITTLEQFRAWHTVHVQYLVIVTGGSVGCLLLLLTIIQWHS